MAKFKEGKLIGSDPEPQPTSAPMTAQEAAPGPSEGQEAPKATENGQTRQRGSQRTLHPELRAAQRVDTILADLTPAAAQRVLVWVRGWQDEREALAFTKRSPEKDTEPPFDEAFSRR